MTLRRVLAVVLASLLPGACAPTVPQDGLQSSVVAQFDPTANPAISPTPNDLVLSAGSGRVNFDPAAASSAAHQEYVSNYLSGLRGFPLSSLVSESFSAALDPTSITPQSVRLLDATTSLAAPLSLGATVTYDDTSHSILLRPPGAGWERGHRYAVAFVGGDTGLKGAGGTRVVGSSIWGLLRLKEALVMCDPPPGTACHATTNIIPSQVYDPAGRLADQARTAVELERMRLLYAPLLTFLETQGVSRVDVTLLWTFTIHDAGEVTFDPLSGAYPFPTDALRTGGHVSLQTAASGSTGQAQQVAAINTLDGFATTLPLVSQNAVSAGPVTGGDLDLTSLVPHGTQENDFGSYGVMKVVAGDAGTVVPATACLGCASTTNPAPLELVPSAPLDERSLYAGYVTIAAMDTAGKRLSAAPGFALARSTQTLLTADGHSALSELTDAQAQRLETFRVALQPALQALESAGLSRVNLVTAWGFTTQSTLSTLRSLTASPSLSPNPVYLYDATAQITVPSGGFDVGKVYEGALFLPTLAGSSEKAPFLLVVPSSFHGAGPFPLVLFRHDWGEARTDGLQVAATLASDGFATLAIDATRHGERSACTGSAAFLAATSDDSACAMPSQQRCSPTTGRCVARSGTGMACSPSAATPGDLACEMAGQGRCIASAGAVGGFACEGGSFAVSGNGIPLVSGFSYFQPLNAAVTRDSAKQAILDTQQLVAMLRATGAGSLAASLPGASLDATRISLLGQGLGADEGALVTAVSPDVVRAVLNVPGADLLGTPQQAELDAALAAQGLLPGMSGYDIAVRRVRWLLEPAAPVSVSTALLSTPLRNASSSRGVLVQYISADPVTPNASTQTLIADADKNPPLSCSVSQLAPSASDVSSGMRHAFLTNQSAVTAQAQAQVGTFLQTGTTP